MRGAVFHEGDALERLREMRSGSVHCAVTSPPFYKLRDYDMLGQVGHEKTPQVYCARLVAIFSEMRRVLRDDGTFFLNLGDSYAGSRAGPRGATSGTSPRAAIARHRSETMGGAKPKDLIGIPWMVAFALRDAGWYLRSDIVWQKENPQPESVTDRPTRAHEYIFMFAKSERYYYDAHAIAETCTTGYRGSSFTRGKTGVSQRRASQLPRSEYATRNGRSVWTMASQPFSEAHFAVFPQELPRRAILAGTSEDGCCAKCGAPRVRQLARTKMVVRESPRRAAVKRAATGSSSRTQVTGTMTEAPSARTVGWRAGCKCDAATVPCVVLDPFSGAGTTGLVALKNGRRFVGIELNPAYIEMAERRIRNKMRGRP